MTKAEYDNIREMIEARFRKDMAALERVWFTIHGVNPPDTVVALAPPAQDDAPVAAAGLTPFVIGGKKPRKPWSPEARERAAKRMRERFRKKTGR